MDWITSKSEAALVNASPEIVLKGTMIRVRSTVYGIFYGRLDLTWLAVTRWSSTIHSDLESRALHLYLVSFRCWRDMHFFFKGPMKALATSQKTLSTLFGLPPVLFYAIVCLHLPRFFHFYRTTKGGYPTCPLSGLPDLIKKIVDEDNKTPLLIDNSEDEKVTAFLSYKVAPLLI